MKYCPNCKKELIIVERENVELDYCMFCCGFWFDYNEWNILSKKLISQDLLDNPEDIFDIPVALSGEKAKRCPVCGKKMEKFLLFDVLLDRCPDKHGVWFDMNEFSRCLNSMSANGKSKKQIEFLGEVFNV